jgi:outer membrane murein-binding lipoprotein Lpp
MTSGKSQSARRALGAALGFGCLLSVAGCDYWPPALQAQIEQLRSETETLNMEKTQLQNQVTDLSKARQDLQVHVDELSRVNREKTEIITSLQRRLDASHGKGGKALAPSKVPAKSMAKPSAKTPVKKKATVRR